MTVGGSDTVQDLFDCFGGQALGTNGGSCSTPAGGKLVSTNGVGINSWDAYVPNGAQWSSIITTLGGPALDRWNGSGAGRTALADIISNTGWSECQVSGGVSTTNASCASPPNAQQAPPMAGQITFSRSSSVGSHFGQAGHTGLSYIPIATDGVSYAYYCPTTPTATSGNDCAALAHLTTAQLAALYGGTDHGVLPAGPGGLAHDTVSACSLQTGSGTYQFFGVVTGDGSQATMLGNVSTDACGQAVPAGLEENSLNAFATTATGLAPGSDWVVPVSIGSEVGQHNGYGLDRSSTALGTAGIGIGVINDTTGTTAALTEPFDCGGVDCANATTAGAWAPDHTYYGGQFGRYLFVVAQTSILSGLHKNNDFIQMFDSGATSLACTATGVATSAEFGFAQQYTNADGLTGESGGACGTVLGVSDN